MRTEKIRNEQGFTMVELLVAMVLSLIVMGAVFLTFKSQQDSYVVQDQIVATQQNARAAMYLLTRDIQMAGYCTNFDPMPYAMDWDNLDGDSEAIRPLIYGRNNVNDGGGTDGIKDGTDVIVVVKASDNFGFLGAGDSASGTTITLNDLQVGSEDGQIDLNSTGKKFGLMVKADLSKAEFFEISSGTGSPTFTTISSLTDTYEQNDMIYRADVIIYRISDDDPVHPSLVRRNLGRDNAAGTYEVVAEDIDNLQLRYLLDDGTTWLDDPSGQEPRVRAVQVSLLARTARENRGYTDTNSYLIGDNPTPTPNDHYRRRLLTSIIKTRNIGL